MIFDKQQYEILAQYEENFNQVLDQRVYRNVGDRHIKTIAEIWHAVQRTPPRRYTCSQCRFNLLTQVGKAYRADKAEREQIASAKGKTTKSTARKNKSK